MWRFFNPNRCGKSVGDCAVRAVCAALGLTWQESFDLLCDEGRRQCDMPSSNVVWGAVLERNGFALAGVPGRITAREFGERYPRGCYVLAFNRHVAPIIDGVLYDSWDSSNELPIYCFREV